MFVKSHRGPIEVAAGRPFIEAIKEVASGLGLSAFRVFVNGVEVTSEASAPATLDEEMAVSIQPDDIAA